jgi:predicted PurR-regulated permease PerM
VLTQRQSSSDISRLLALIAGVVVVATLYFARAVLVPFALAMLFSFLLTPLVRLLERLRLPRVLAVLLVVVLAMAGAVFMAVKVTSQLVEVTTELPTYRANFEKKIASLHDGSRIGILKASEEVSELGAEMVQTLPGAAQIDGPRNRRGVFESKSTKPVEVQVVTPPGGAWDSWLTVLTPVGAAGVVLVFTVFILLRIEDLRNRFIRLVGHNHLRLTTQALDDASERIGKYLLLQLLVNVSYGIVIGTGLHFIGLPNAVLWGAMAAVCRFLPYVGTPLAAFMPIVLSLAVFDGWTRSLVMVGLYLVTEIVVANFVEPMLYGANTGMSSLAILVAAIFWTLLWGPKGLVLSTPLTVCLVVLGRHVPQMEFLHVLLGDEPVLAPEMHFYQRLLASDLGEARQVLEANQKEMGLQKIYDFVVVPALGMVQRDRQQNDLDESFANSIVQHTRELVEELNEEYTDPRALAPDTTHEPSIGTKRTNERSPRIICVPAKTEADETIGSMLAQLIDREGESAQYMSLGIPAEMIDKLAAGKPDVVIVSSLQPYALTHARKLYSQIRARLPEAIVMVGLWNFQGAIESVMARFGPDAQGLIVTTLAAAIEKLGALNGSSRDLQEPDAVGSR